ncbi:ImmA/IrrE family metallo-endopeptidase [Staphylococcus pettenkoferi]|uniref:ImmA/IrrE family metallo-endopeptidase n=1 Tax=Staphylococcus pettenkoferi TaxID=170573 RepID=A0ABT4BKU7_9STAP|nr:ImmA/IrrE family metallo-endopeptidase [Staphylococcus pettenkoferi]MCY1563872.1 ImmA/IrrE family metallo-endopeptidase [Staphylococcus pettenkoferi]MCY1583298.1 ImmA/IrrE family metallo-endopeptidase [Staphylococcus pettenkoferi]
MIIEKKVNALIEELRTNEVAWTISDIANHLNILIAYNEELSCIMYYRDCPIIYLKNSDTLTMWEEFTHELGHYVLHDTNQRTMDDMFNEKQEHEADKFSRLFRMPQTDIEEHELFTQDKLIEFFRVTYEDAHKRLQLLVNQYSSEGAY